MRPWGVYLSYFNIHIVAIVSVVRAWGIIVWAQLFSFALNLVIFPFLIVLDRWRGGGGGVSTDSPPAFFSLMT